MQVIFRLFQHLNRLHLRGWVLAKKHPRKTAALSFFLLLWLFCLPRPLFQEPFSTVLEARDGELLGARITDDGQWRFPPPDSLPSKYVDCLIEFEDRRFRWHPGIDPLSMARAMWLNMSQARVVSGGSTITMQVIRMARSNPPRNLWQKFVEMFMATRLELTYSKNSILKLYAAHAPFGGNVVGIEAACWRYYGKPLSSLTWAEAATLAVLPNSPALIHPGRNRNALMDKRNRLLHRILESGKISEIEYQLASEEPLPTVSLALPDLAPHLLDRLTKAAAGKSGQHRFSCTVDYALQQRVAAVLARRQEIYRGNDINNLAAIIIDVPTGEVLAYVGNVIGAGKEHGESVDVIAAPRSTGSILKPYLYALALESGDILPRSLLTDVPIQLGQYKPENYYETYDGAVPAKRALIRSLNVPFVLLLQQYGLEKFHFQLRQLGLTTIQKPPSHYGLSLILGGAEANLLDITNTYACMARRLGSFYDLNGKSRPDDFRPADFEVHQGKRKMPAAAAPLSAGSIWHTFEAMREVERPNSVGEWELFRASRPVAWKTGTSFGFRDAWAAGVTPRYAVGVWVGNADGEGRPGLIGVDMAAPVLFELFEQLPNDGRWFDPPYDDMVQMPVCQMSGYRATDNCPADTVWVQENGQRSAACPYHEVLHLDSTLQYQVNSDCVSPSAMRHVPWFVLPPEMEFFFKTKNPNYASPPPFRADCLSSASMADQSPMQLIYPKQAAKIYVPVDLNGQLSSTIFRVAHRKPDIEIHWHLDGKFIGTTRTFHQMSLQPAAGPHQLTLVDKDGFRLERSFEILGGG
ncbi:MAG: penicillin-binding protein 1C [Saprospiraceae bacterium]|nr:penicillin-binding protein 1C [Saprospiraceae bacterium]